MSKVKVTVRPLCGQISTLACIFSHICGMHVCILVKLITCTHCRVQITGHDFSRSWTQRSRSQITFSESALFWQRHTNQRFTVEDHLVRIFLHYMLLVLVLVIEIWDCVCYGKQTARKPSVRPICFLQNTTDNFLFAYR